MEDPANPPMAQSTRDLIDKLLLERWSLAAIVRITGISECWLQSYVNQKYYLTPKQAKCPKKPGKLSLQLDEMWSFVGSKQCKQWIWLAMDAET